MWNENIGIKVKRLEIKQFRIFDNFTINFCDKNNTIQPLIVLAGINGTGKTTILETISMSYQKNTKLYLIEDGKEYSLDSISKPNNTNIIKSGFSKENQNFSKSDADIYYYPVNIKMDDIKELLPHYIDKLIYEEDIKASDVYQKLKDIITNDIFNNLDLNIEFNNMDANKTLSFKTKMNNAIVNIDNLSTGEKTIFTKILHLYLSNIKNKIILIDEPELSLHPSWQNKVLKLYEDYALENNCQIIIATHSPHIINSSKNEYLRILKFVQNKIEAIDDIIAYGRDIKWVLKEVMGIDFLRDIDIIERFNEINELIIDRNFGQAENKLDNLETIIGQNDKQILSIRNEIEFERLELEGDI
jgi:predicted ATP-binding protein involved in virulence